jgi:hypothetical protein
MRYAKDNISTVLAYLEHFLTKVCDACKLWTENCFVRLLHVSSATSFVSTNRLIELGRTADKAEGTYHDRINDDYIIHRSLSELATSICLSYC